ncbi:hypothetical protein NBRC116493_00390 [Aurantivibrio infirmus]
MPGLKITNQSIEDGLDRKHLTIIKRRFLHVNEERKTRARSVLANRQRIFFDLLPLIFHINHPMLPGYVSGLNCFGINQYEPNQNEIKLTQSISKSFRYNKRAKIKDDIQAIYVMGSVGTIAHSDSSDLDIWICYSPDLTHQQHQKLQLRCDKVKAWGAQLGLDVHFFLMDPDVFQRGEVSSLSTESSGSAQHFLLLDEFYRTAIYLAGKLPLWWFVPSNCENNYSSYSRILLEKRFIREAEVIDFGPVAQIPKEEFIGAGIWQLYKAIESPYKSLLKLLLLEAYLHESTHRDHAHPLCLDFKQKIYDSEPNSDDLDPYIIILRKIELCLNQQKQIDRLQLARRCLYFKTDKKLTKPSRDSEILWQFSLLKKVVAEWCWSSEYVSFLDNRKHWNIKQSISESENLIIELKKSYQLLLESKNESSNTALITQHEFDVLGRKLAANFGSREGKIPLIHKDLSDQVGTTILCFLHSENSKDSARPWALCSGDITLGYDRSQALQQSTEVLPLIVWAHWNGVLTNRSQFKVVHKNNTPSVEEILKVSNFLRHQLPRRSTIAHEAFEKNASTEALIFLVNFAKEKSGNSELKQMARISDQDDAFSYGVFHENLISTIDLVTRNNWGEVTVHRFDQNAVVDCAQFILDLIDKSASKTPPGFHVYCDTPNYGLAIERRFKSLIGDLFEHFLFRSSHTTPSFFFAVGSGYYALSRNFGGFEFTHLANYSDLVRTRKFFNNRHTPCVLDSHISPPKEWKHH